MILFFLFAETAGQIVIQRTGEANAGIETGCNTHDHGEHEDLGRVTAEDDQSEQRQQCGDGGIDRTGKSQRDTVVHQRSPFRSFVIVLTFYDAVKHNDGGIDGITHNREDGRNEGAGNFQLENGEYREYDESIVKERKDGRNAEPELETNGDVDQHQSAGQS